jgi:hypothetical protein
MNSVLGVVFSVVNAARSGSDWFIRSGLVFQFCDIYISSSTILDPSLTNSPTNT